MSDHYPIFLNLEGRPCLVVGGGRVASRKVRGLLDSGAHITVVSPRVTEELEKLARQNRIQWIEREYCEQDLAEQFLAFVATDQESVSEAVLQDAQSTSTLVCAVKKESQSHFQTPAKGKVDEVQFAISTGGQSPSRARELKEKFLADLKAQSSPDSSSDSSPHPQNWKSPARSGHVYLVGAGPGSGGLLTQRGQHLLDTCDVVYYDRLIGKEIINSIPDSVEKIYVGKQKGHSRPDTGELLAQAAQKGKAVVRLKGGDPNLYGRGGEEMTDLLYQEVPFEIVPGVSALTAVPSAAGIPVTYRNLSREVVIRSGYRLPDPESDRLQKPNAEETTYVYFMTVGRLAEIVEELLNYDQLPSETPIAIIQKGTLPEQETLTATLGTVLDIADKTPLQPPALVIVGQVVHFRNRKSLLNYLKTVEPEFTRSGWLSASEEGPSP